MPSLAELLAGVSQPAGSIPPQDPTFMRNQAWTKPGDHNYNTPLPLSDEMAFRVWLGANRVPFDPQAGATDYDMRGFYKALHSGDPLAASSVNPNDNAMHYPDYWKTPLHETFSNESQWAAPNAPRWTPDDRLVDMLGNVIFDERAQR